MFIPYSEYETKYGPYKCKDGRYRLVFRNTHEDQITVSYPKYLMEVHLGRYLTLDEEVHHKDEDYGNNDLTNLVVLQGTLHRKLHAKDEVDCLICLWCDKMFEVTGKRRNYYRHNKQQGKTGPFCGRKCAGKYNQQFTPRKYG